MGAIILLSAILFSIVTVIYFTFYGGIVGFFLGGAVALTVDVAISPMFEC